MKNKITKALLLSSILATSTFAADGGGFGLSQESLSEARKTLKSAVGQINAAVKIVENTIYPNLGTYGVNTQGTTPTTLIDFINLSGSLASSLSSSFDSSTFAKTPYFSTLEIVDQNLYVKAQFTSSSIVDSKSGTSSAVPIFEPFLGKRIILIPIFNITYDSSNKITIKDAEISGWECLTDADGGISNSGISIAGGMRSVVSMGGGALGSCQYILSSSLDSLWSGTSTSLTQCTNDNAGNATWTPVSPGSSSTGTCNSGYTAINSSKMSRSCYSSNGAATLESVGSNGTTSSGNFAGCQVAQCTNDSAGNATWTTANAGSSSTGTCNSNYTAVNSSKMSRSCSVSNGVASLESVGSNGATSSGNFAGCTLAQCTNDNAGNATWTTVNAGSSSTGTCNSGYTATNSSKMSRSCSVSNGVASLETVQSSGATSSGNFAGCTAASTGPILYSRGNYGTLAQAQSYYQGKTYIYSDTNVTGLRDGTSYYFLINYSFSEFWNKMTIVLPASAGSMAPVDWFIANPSKQIIDYCVVGSSYSRPAACKLSPSCLSNLSTCGVSS